jgi:HK97 family phage major capsid protein
MENDLTLEAVNKSIQTAGEALKKEAKDAKDLAQKAMEDFNSFKATVGEKADKSEIAEMQKQFDALSTSFEKSKQTNIESKKVSLIDEVVKNKSAIRELVKTGRGTDIELKADTLRASITDNETSFHLPDIGQLGVKTRSLYDVLPKVNVPTGMHNGTISYIDWDEATTVRAASAIAEGAPFLESTAKFAYYTEPLKKVGDILPVSEEFGEDAVSAAADLSRFLMVNVEQEVSRQLTLGDGASNTFRGLLNRSIAYVPVGASIIDANLKDLVRKMRTTIIKPRGSKYSPNVVVMNSDTYDKYFLAKDGEGRYLFEENGTIAGLAVVEDNFMPDNQLVVGDRRFASIYQMSGIVLSEGFVGDQFGEDLKSIKARKRCLMLIREVDRTGFLKCTDIEDALATLAGT